MFNSCVTEEAGLAVKVFAQSIAWRRVSSKKNISDVDTIKFNVQLEIIFLILETIKNECLQPPFESYAKIMFLNFYSFLK